MKSCYFCKRDQDGDACDKCMKENDLAAVLTYGYEKDYSGIPTQATLMFEYKDRIALINLYFENYPAHTNKMVASISNVIDDKTPDATLMFKQVLKLYDVNITPQNVKEKLKKYMVFK